MSNLIVKIIVFSILLNFSTALMSAALGFEQTDMGGLTNDPKIFNAYNQTFQGSLDPNNQIQDTSNLFDRILDSIGLGFIYKWLNMVDQYMFGFVNLLQGVFSPLLGETLTAIFFGFTKTIMFILYTIFGFRMFTGKDVTI